MSILSVSPSHFTLTILALMRRAGAAAVFVWGWFVLASFRTQQFGEDGRSLLIYLLAGSVWVFLPSLLVFLQHDFGRTIRQALALTLLSVLAAIGWANSEEAVVVSTLSNTCMVAQPQGCDTLTGAKPAEEGFVYRRAWPFQNHTISYSTSYGWQGGD